jgi:hypothetical protein
MPTLAPGFLDVSFRPITCRSPTTGFGHRNFNLRFEIVQRRSGALQMSFSSICADRPSLVTARIVGAHDGYLAGMAVPPRDNPVPAVREKQL